MADDEEAEEEPAVELGEGATVEGAPLAQVSSRLTWPIKQSRLAALEGDSTIRTPDGPQTIADVLEHVDITYFEKRQEFEAAVRDVIGRGPVATEDE
ncbi:DUF5789 family protein [Haloarchaeobius sp. DFWS5]|uniref:DUF5789 family protein n=1 Tax=Haloarchaeobius sp. DFWS5 TaxID=3446114 RepID=UPI003EBC5504